MMTRKSIWFALIFFLSTIIIALPLSHSALPKNYQEKKVFYDSLSIVLNKYIVPVGNWGLLEGILQGMQSHIGVDQFTLKFENNLVDILIKDSPPLQFSKDKIDTNAIELVETLLELIKKSLENGEDVLISGFGKFSVRKKKERRGRNPATGREMMIESRKVVTFKSSGNLRDKINGCKETR